MDHLGSSHSDDLEEKGLKVMQSDLFMHKQVVTNKLISSCIESLIGTYVKVSINYNKIIFKICINTNLFLL